MPVCTPKEHSLAREKSAYGKQQENSYRPVWSRISLYGKGSSAVGFHGERRQVVFGVISNSLLEKMGCSGLMKPKCLSWTMGESGNMILSRNVTRVSGAYPGSSLGSRWMCGVRGDQSI